MSKEIIIKNAELVEVAYENDDKKAVLTFLDKENGEIREVNFNKQVYKDGKYIDNEEKANTVDEWCKEYFNTPFDKLTDCIGTKKDIFAYPNFSSLFKVDMVEKFTAEQKGKIYQTTIKDIIVDDLFIRVRYEADGEIYETKYSMCKFVESMQQYFPDPVKKQKELDKFKEKFGASVDDKDFLIGEKIIVEVKSAFGKYFYGEIKDRVQ